MKAALDDLVKKDVLAEVKQPTEWISSMVTVPKKNGQLRICLDPKDLNAAIQREHYPLPVIEDVATRLHGAKTFSVLDASNGFWHVELDEQSSLLTTFHTPFDCYRWLCMPFGLSSAPEVFQRRMHELIEGLEGIEVIADDFVIVGYGKTQEEATLSHDCNLISFLKRCEERGVKLAEEKMKLRRSSVPFIGHIASADGLLPDPAKVEAITRMLKPTDVRAVQRLLGLAQYLAKFLPKLSDITKPLRDLTSQGASWKWCKEQEMSLQALKKAAVETPVLQYYTLDKEVTIQCDASQSGLGAALLQNGQHYYRTDSLLPMHHVR